MRVVLDTNVVASGLLWGGVPRQFEPGERGPQEDALRFQFEAVAQLSAKERAVIMELIDGMLLKHDAKRWMQAR